MKKKKPKKSPSKSPPQKPPPSSPVVDPPTLKENQPPSDSLVASDAQIDSMVDAEAQPPLDCSDLELNPTKIATNETEIAVSTADPSPVCDEELNITLESSSGGPPQSSSESVLNREASSSEKPNPEAGSKRATAEAKVVPSSSQSAEESLTEDQPCLKEIGGSQERHSDLAIPTKSPQESGSQLSTKVSKEDTKQESPAPLPQRDTTEDWCAHARGYGKRLSKKGEAFTLPTGEACIKIPNEIIEKNRKAWDSFVLGQFYSDPPSQGTIHNIVNGIWSKQYRDISVSKMEGYAFLFKIPNAATRARVIKQCLWQIEGQTMFVYKWEPGVIPTKPELTSAPIWLELRQVPFQFFHEDGLERIAGLVGHPKFLHPATANKTNLEVAKVFTIIDPRKPLPEAVNVQFDSGEISRVLVSSPWMPPVCESCKEIGHVTRRCPSSVAAKPCSRCKSLTHITANCPQKQSQDPQKNNPEPTKRKTRRSKSRGKQIWKRVDQVNLPQTEAPRTEAPPPIASTDYQHTEIVKHSKLGTGCDVETSDSELEEGEFSDRDREFQVVRNKKKFSGLKQSGQKGNRGRSLKLY
ncbi:uncharacterized protein LOC117132412 isoform X2 [Brassica rapa]|uniref:uncharacterized protein LOC117132412 isoform X1 n=1 Tax=Brassica campestris TaxID=3711 RepID=UPI00142DE9F0|nr:uncharacterized protein LOC117132412 isoform X1 [Brassica rapa]XP_033142268.1 uncharacterized protein LOC117132412 isoform X2 [Brassica rapa]